MTEISCMCIFHQWTLSDPPNQELDCFDLSYLDLDTNPKEENAIFIFLGTLRQQEHAQLLIEWG